ncbi:MAG TPA: TlpA disulfide reductase family protein [bacterium]|nr:TlpA disulfide reductase family protein [bacterium]
MKYKIFLIIVLVLALAIGAETAVDTMGTRTEIGQKAPQFSMDPLSSKSLSMADLKGELILINFFATWCNPCMQEMPRLEKEIWQEYQDDGLQVFCVGREHSAKELKKLVKDKNLTVPIVPDPEREIYSHFASKYIPRNIIIDQQGKIIFQEIGYNDEKLAKIKKIITEKLND